MAWIAIDKMDWEYSTTPDIDDPDNAHSYSGRHVDGIRTNSDGTSVYVYCRQLNRTEGIGYGELKEYTTGLFVVTHLDEVVTHEGSDVTLI